MSNLFLIRFTFYFLFFLTYIFFMSSYAPLGIEWLPWHSQRIYNFSEFLALNGYFSNYGFSIWNKCESCSSDPENWKDRIYLSIPIFSNIFYVVFNDLFGGNNLKQYGHVIDKTIIFLTGIIFAEIYQHFSNKKISNLRLFLKSSIIFTFFIINPWTYKMILGAWANIYFPIFFLLGFLFFLKNNYTFGLLFFFLAGLFDYQSSAGLAFYYILLTTIFFFKKEKQLKTSYFPTNVISDRAEYKIIFSLLISVFIYLILRLIAMNEMETTVGTSILTRIGISGDDFHNGGLLGSLQFLGGNRITACLIDFDLKNISDMSKSIKVYNCILSITSMVFLSILSVIGLFFLKSDNNLLYNSIILPILFILLSYTFILQQSSSVHLMGYSYFFSFIFSIGITSIIFRYLEKFKFSIPVIILTIPVLFGIIFLCIRVSMLTGVNG